MSLRGTGVACILAVMSRRHIGMVTMRPDDVRLPHVVSLEERH